MNASAQADSVVGKALRLIFNSGGVDRGKAKGVESFFSSMQKKEDLIPTQIKSLAKSKNISMDEATEQINNVYNAARKQAGTSYDSIVEDMSQDAIAKKFGGLSRDEVIDAASLNFGLDSGGAPIGTSEKDLKKFAKSMDSYVNKAGSSMRHHQTGGMVKDFYSYGEGLENMKNGMAFSDNTALQGALVRTGVTAGGGLIAGSVLFGDDDYE